MGCAVISTIEGSAEAVMFDQSIEQLDEGPDGVTVTFADGSRRDYELVFLVEFPTGVSTATAL